MVDRKVNHQIKGVGIFIAAILMIGAIALGTADAVTTQNLLTNPGAESGDLSGWTILATGGNGWGIWGVDTTDYEGPYEGNYCFLTSYGWCKRGQEIDLQAKGYTEAQLDRSPHVQVEEWFGQANPYCRGRYYVKIELRDTNHKVITSWDSGEHYTTWRGIGLLSWDKLSHEFSNYGAGLRYIYWEDGGIDEKYWAGYYGAKLDSASLTLAADVPACTPLGLIALVALLSAIAAVTLVQKRR
ncbi:MAG: hypothetical protein ACP5E9_09230 [Candidatus Methanospirareceae archaeon]